MKGYLAVVTLLLLTGYLVTAPLAGRWMLERLASQYPVLAVDDCPAADAIVVMAGTGPPRAVPLRVEEPMNRIEAGLALYRAGKAPRIVMAAAIDERIGLGQTSKEGWLLLSPARGTADEADRIVEEVRKQSWGKLILVTSGFHMGRAMRLFAKSARREGIALTIMPFPADPLLYEHWPPGAKSLQPGITGWEYSTRALREMFGQLAF